MLVTRGYMARGKDGFESLLAKSEGGQAEEIVSEENGILISMMLRQYFMSLKIIGQWKMWGESMARHWKGIHESLHEAHPIIEPQTLDKAGGNTESTDIREVKEAIDKAAHGEDDDDAHTDEPEHVREAADKREREMHLIKKVSRKWRRLAGLPGHPHCCDSMEEGEFTVDWTRVGGF